MGLRRIAAVLVFSSPAFATAWIAIGGCAQVLDIDVLPVAPSEGGVHDGGVQDSPRGRPDAVDDASRDADGPGTRSYSIQETTVHYNWDVGQYHWSGDTHLLLYASDAPNPYQDFVFTEVSGVKDGWTICNQGLRICLSDDGGYVVLGATEDTWVTTVSGESGTIQNYASKRYIEPPTPPDAGDPITTGSDAGVWAFDPPH
jgi:hypothetical protein